MNLDVVAGVAIVCGSALVALRWHFLDRRAARETVKVQPLVELEAKLQKIEAQVQAQAWRAKQ